MADHVISQALQDAMVTLEIPSLVPPERNELSLPIPSSRRQRRMLP